MSKNPVSFPLTGFLGPRDAVRQIFLPLLANRRFQAYAVGAPRSGTQSIARIFEGRYRSLHEPQSQRLVEVLEAYVAGRVDAGQTAAYLKTRDRRLWLEMDSSHILVFFIDILVREFPRAKFILTIRDCYSWIESCMNQELRMKVPYWERVHRLRFSRPESHPPQESALAEMGLHTIDGYLADWARHNRRVLEIVPPERLLVVRTHEIEADLPRIAAFLGADLSKLNASRSHSHKAESKIAVLDRLDRAYLRGRFEFHCRELMDRFFPGFVSPY